MWKLLEHYTDRRIDALKRECRNTYPLFFRTVYKPLRALFTICPLRERTDSGTYRRAALAARSRARLRVLNPFCPRYEILADIATYEAIRTAMSHDGGPSSDPSLEMEWGFSREEENIFSDDFMK